MTIPLLDTDSEPNPPLRPRWFGHRRALVERMALGVWGLWAGWLLANYYPQVARFISSPPGDWVMEAYSLLFLPSLRAFLTGELPLVPGFPAGGEALFRAAAGFSGAFLVLAAALTLGTVAFRLLRWSPERLVERLVFQLTLGLGTLAQLSLVLALGGAFRTPLLRLLIPAIAVIGIIAGREKLASMPARIRAWRAPSGEDRLWMWVILIAGAVAMLAALAPEHEADAVWYHLGFPAMWLESGRLIDLPEEYVSLYPMIWELLFGTGMALGGPVAAKLLHFATLPLTGAVVFWTARRFLRATSPWLAVALFVTAPTVLWEASTAYVDLAVASFTLLAIYALLRYLAELRWQWLVLAGIHLGLALGTKHLTLLMFVLVVPGLAVLLWKTTRQWRQTLLAPACLAGVALILAGFWYARAWLATGNPFFPELFDVFGAPAHRWDVISDQALDRFTSSFGRPRSMAGLLSLPWDVTVHGARYGGGLGPLFLLFLPPLVIHRTRTRILAWLTVLALCYVALWASPLSSFQLRFLVPLTPILALLAAQGAAVVREMWSEHLGRRWTWGWPTILGVLLVMNLPWFMSLHEADRQAWDGWFTHVLHQVPVEVVAGIETADAYLTDRVSTYAAWRFINDTLPADARILDYGPPNRLYSERSTLGAQSTMARRALTGSSAERLAALERLRVSHVLVESSAVDDPPDPFIAELRACPSLYSDHRWVLVGLSSACLRPPGSG